MGQNTFRSVVKPRQKKVTTDFAGVLDFSERTTSFKIASGQSLPFTSVANTEHLIEGQSVEIANESTSDILVDGSLIQSGIGLDVEPDTASVLIWTSTGKFLDLGGSAAIKDIEEDLVAHKAAYTPHVHNGVDTNKVEGVNLGYTNATESEVLRIVSGKPEWSNPFQGVEPDSARMVNSDSTTDINTLDWTEIPVTGYGDMLPGTSNIVLTGTGIWIGISGRVKFKTNIYMQSLVTSSSVQLSFAINGVRQPGISSNAYIRNHSGHNESSSYLSKTLVVQPGDTVTVVGKMSAASGAVTMVAGESYLEAEIAASTMSQGVKGTDGYAGWEFLSGSIVPASGLGTNGDVYLRTTTGDFYKKALDNWTLISNFTGPIGHAGPKTDLIFAEEDGGLNDNSLQWSFGDGSVSNGSVDFGLAMPYAGKINGMTISMETAGASTVTVEPLINGASVGRSVSATAGVGKATADFGVGAVPFLSGDVISFRTVLGGGASDARVCAVVEFT